MPLFFKPSHWLGGAGVWGGHLPNLKHFACGREDEGQVREYEGGLGKGFWLFLDKSWEQSTSYIFPVFFSASTCLILEQQRMSDDSV